MNTKLIGVGFLAAAALAVSIFAIINKPTTTSAPDQQFGSVAGPDIQSPYISVNNVYSYYYSKGFTKATTTPCSFKSPAATTSVAMFSVNFTVSSTTATKLTFTKGSAMQASTTLLSGLTAIGANAKGSFVSSTTAAGGTGNPLGGSFIIAPNQWLQVNLKGGTGTVSPVGLCQLILNRIS